MGGSVRPSNDILAGTGLNVENRELTNAANQGPFKVEDIVRDPLTEGVKRVTIDRGSPIG